jgi:hypothetical protein
VEKRGKKESKEGKKKEEKKSGVLYAVIYDERMHGKRVIQTRFSGVMSLLPFVIISRFCIAMIEQV